MNTGDILVGSDYAQGNYNYKSCGNSGLYIENVCHREFDNKVLVMEFDNKLQMSA